jgi:NAD(P)-dependent dehydrogenase (short-subunit alcohol dehydrogenase family)
MALKVLLRQKWYPPIKETGSFDGQHIIITGANTGLGLEAAVKYAALGAAKVILGVRNLDKGAAAKATIESRTGRKDCIEVWELDMMSYDSVKAFAKRVEALDHLDVAILNAGVWRVEFSVSKYGWEEDLQVNVLSTTLLCLLLVPKMKSGPDSTNQPAIIIVSSGMHKIAALKTEEGNLLEAYNKEDGYNSYSQYGLSKLFLMAAMKSIAAKSVDSGVKVVAICPGVCQSELGRDYNSYLAVVAIAIVHFLLFRPAEAGARTYVSAVSGGENGGFFKDDVNEQ